MTQQQLLISLISLLILVPVVAFWLWMFDNMLKTDNLPTLVTADAKSDWTLAFIIFNVFTAVFYFVVVYRNRN